MVSSDEPAHDCSERCAADGEPQQHRVRERPEATVQLERGATLLLYTDGLVERRRDHFDTGIARTVEALRGAGPVSEDELAEHLLRTVLSGEQQDDAALLLYRHRNPAPFLRTIPAEAFRLADLRRELRGWLDGTGASADEVDAVLVAVGEACANAIEHGCDFAPQCRVELEATLVASTLAVTVRDDGRWIPPRDTPGRGRGRALMERLMNETRIEPGSDGTVVRMWKDLGHAG